MSQSVDKIIPVTWNIKRSGLGLVSFGVALAAYGDAETDEDKKMGLFTSYEDIAERHPERTELLEVAQNWFDTGGATLLTIGYAYAAPVEPETKIKALEAPKEAVKEVPTNALSTQEVTKQSTRLDKLVTKLGSLRSISDPTTFTEALEKAADSSWFYFPFSTHTETELTQEEVEDAVSWCDANSRFAMITVTNETAIDPTVTDDLGAYLMTLGYRRCAVGYTAINKFMGVRVAGMMSLVDYSQVNSYKDAEYKSINQTADEIGGTAIAALTAKGYYFHTDIAAKASNTGAMLQNTVTTSEYDETIAEVMGTDSYLINLQTKLLDVVTSQKNLPQTPDGQQLAISAADAMGEMYITNGFLGEREIIHPVTKETFVTRGYITTTKPTDVYNLTDEDRAAHKLYPIEQYIYRAGSAWTVAATINIW